MQDRTTGVTEDGLNPFFLKTLNEYFGSGQFHTKLRKSLKRREKTRIIIRMIQWLHPKKHGTIDFFGECDMPKNTFKENAKILT